MREALAGLVDEYMASGNAFQPVGATGRGFHDFDADLGDRSVGAIEERARALRGFLERLDGVDKSELKGLEEHDAELLSRRLRWELTDLEEVRPWQRSPTSYLSTIGQACNGLVIRDFAPLDGRVRSLVSRLSQVPAFLDQARANVDGASRFHVENAMETGNGLRSLFERDLPAAVAGASDPALKSSFEAASRNAFRAVGAYLDWLRREALPAADEEFAWGPEVFRKLLSFSDSVDDPIETLIKRCDDDLRAHQELLKQIAGRIDAAASAEDVVEAVSKDHPSAEELIPHTGGLLERLRQFSVEAGLCTMPTEVRIRVQETPAFSRATTQAACSTPGPFEEVAKEAYYYVTPPDAAWPPERVESYLKFFNRWSLPGVTAHEAYPGHYVHLTYLRTAQSRLGRYLNTTSTVEGWAHYIEQALIEAGYGDGDPRLHLMQVREALLRLCRYRCAFGMHVEGWNVQQGVDFFVREGYSTPVIAERETRRGIVGPNYYAYTLGKHQILALRDKLRAKLGATFDLTRFHDGFMQLPYPVPTIERIMLEA